MQADIIFRVAWRVLWQRNEVPGIDLMTSLGQPQLARRFRRETTLLRTLSGFTPSSGGSIFTVNGRDIQGDPPGATRDGDGFQSYALVGI